MDRKIVPWHNGILNTHLLLYAYVYQDWPAASAEADLSTHGSGFRSPPPFQYLVQTIVSFLLEFVLRHSVSLYVATATPRAHSPICSSFITALTHSSMNQNQPLHAWEGVNTRRGSARIASASSHSRPHTSSANVVSPVEANKNPVPQPYESQRCGTPADRYP
jgi:hypothetical protein